jgi:hypothetical protein
LIVFQIPRYGKETLVANVICIEADLLNVMFPALLGTQKAKETPTAFISEFIMPYDESMDESSTLNHRNENVRS